MKKYSVTLYYHTNIVVEVSAENEQEAIENARQMAARDDQEIIDILLGGMYEDGQPDCEEVDEDKVVDKMRSLHKIFVDKTGRMPRFAEVKIKYTDGSGESIHLIKMREFDPTDTEHDIDDDNVFYYVDGIDGLCSINTEHNTDFTIVDIYGFYDTYIGRPMLFFNKYNDFCNNHDIFHTCVVNGNLYLFTDERIKRADLPEGWYAADVRSSDSDFDKWATIEPMVCVNHAATIISDQPFDFGSDNYIVIKDCDRTYDEAVM